MSFDLDTHTDNEEMLGHMSQDEGDATEEEPDSALSQRKYILQGLIDSLV